MNESHTSVARFLLLLSSLTSFSCRTNGASIDGWSTVTPEEVGLDSAALVEMFDFVGKREIPVHSIQIARHGRLALDAYFYPFAAHTRHDLASVTKSITSTLVGLAIAKGYLADVQQPVSTLFKNRVAVNFDDRKRKLTLEHLLTMTAGWDCGFEPKEARLSEMRRSADWLQFMLDLPMVAEPGTRWAYCSGNCHVLSVLLTQITGTNALTFARRELFNPLGITDVAWPTDPHGNNHGWGDLQMHPRDMAKIGQLFLQRGRWAGRQMVPETWVQTATSAHVERTSNNDHYGYFWWVKGTNFPGMFEAVGRGGQRITVWPAKDLVLVMTGGGFEPGDLAPFLLKAIKAGEHLPPNPEGFERLQQRIAAAAKPPSPRVPSKAPALASQISGKKFHLSANDVNLGEVSLTFSNSSEAHVDLVWNAEPLNFPAGMDGVERFSTNRLVNLPQAAKGEWLSDDTFLLRIDLVGGINFYQVKLMFSETGKKVTVFVIERTGLSQEQFTGVISR